jgi:hypothetical protein
MATPDTKGAPVSTHSRGVFAVHPAVRLMTETFLYKLSWPKLLGSNLVLATALLISVSGNVLQARRTVQPAYFAMTPDGRMTPLVPLSEPLVSPEEVVQFAQGCVTRSFSLDFVPDDMRNKLNSLHDCYTDEGFHALMVAFDKSNLITKIRDGRLVSSAVATGAGVISAVNASNPRGYSWTVQQPISITLVNQTERRSYSFVIETHIQRVPTVDNPKGISTTALQIIGNGQNN